MYKTSFYVYLSALVLAAAMPACDDPSPPERPGAPAGAGGGEDDDTGIDDDTSDNEAVPAAWTCAEEAYGDDACDCGCGAPDPACDDAGCSGAGCYAAACSTCTAEDGSATVCLDPDAVWTCSEYYYEDGMCDCGCGVPDPDCGGAGCHQDGCDAPACEYCFEGGSMVSCGSGSSGGTTVPEGWTCTDWYYGDGWCDCNCGVPDPDCAAGECPPPPPEGWTCSAAWYGDGDCECGCGVPDIDCGGGGCTEEGCFAAACDYCVTGGSLGSCAPEGWSCHPDVYGNSSGTCICGCGAQDSNCGELGCSEAGCLAEGCNYCSDGEGGWISCAGEVPEEWTCEAYMYGDGLCHCGCGVEDIDCVPNEEDVFDVCTTAGCFAASCDVCVDTEGEPQVCLEPAPDEWTCGRSAYFNTTSCYCGCGEKHPACGEGGCTEPGCRQDACTVCYDASGAVTSCSSEPAPAGWTCSDAKWNDSKCDCGCGIEDPSCGGESCTEPGCDAAACDTRMPPDTWTCSEWWYNDSMCDCGCGAIDPNCDTGCSEPGCFVEGCQWCKREDGTSGYCN